MTLRDYVIKNYQGVFLEEPSETLRYTLINLYARHIDLEEFRETFGLDGYQEIFAFVVDPANAFEICKMGYRKYELKLYHYGDSPGTSDDNYDYEEGAFVKKFR